MSWWDDNGWSDEGQLTFEMPADVPRSPDPSGGQDQLAQQVFQQFQAPTVAPVAPRGQSAQQIIQQWQATHSPTEGTAGLAAALQAAGISASQYMYGSIPSGNELLLNGQKYKVIAGENSGSPSWYTPGMESGGGEGSGASGDPGFAPIAPYQGAPFAGAPYQGAPFTGTPYQAPSFTPPSGLDEANDPGFMARLKMGTDALQHAAAAKGSILSGGTLKAIERYAQDYASNEYGNVYNRALGTAGFNRDTGQQGFANQFGVSQFNAGQGQQGFRNALDVASFNAGQGQQGYQNRYGQFTDYMGNLNLAANRGLTAASLLYQRPGA